MTAGLDEFDLIRTCFAQRQKHLPSSSGVALGIGDDAAVLNVPAGRQLVLSVDTIVEGVHFPVGSHPADIGWRSLAVNISDLAAMGADPMWFTLSLCIPEASRSWLDAFSEGLFECASRFGAALVGGDTVQGSRCISVQVAGSVPAGAAVTRAGACEGDVILITGSLGDAAGGLRLLQDGAGRVGPGADVDRLISRFQRPEPRARLVDVLRRFAHAAIDISDGLCADLGHVLEASGKGARIESGLLPVSEALTTEFGLPQARRLALAGGDDYELCFTVSEGDVEQVVDLGARFDIPITRIGTIEAGSGLHCVDEAGATVELPASGYRHFRKTAS